MTSPGCPFTDELHNRADETPERNRPSSLPIMGHGQAFSDDIVNSLPGIFYMLDTAGRIVRWNRKLCEVTGYTAVEVGGMSALQFFGHDTGALIQGRVAEAFERGESAVEASLLTKDGRLIPHYFTGRRTQIGDAPYLVGLGIDITARKALEVELQRQAHEDPLTGMATRRHFFDLASLELGRANRHRRPLSLLMLDIDRFKEINDRHGHGQGDSVLRQFAKVCGEILRAEDISGRIGGDEFAILLPETVSDQALRVGERLRHSFSATGIDCKGSGRLSCTISVGVATLRRFEGEGIDLLLSQADQALYRAKKDGRNQVAVY